MQRRAADALAAWDRGNRDLLQELFDGRDALQVYKQACSVSPWENVTPTAQRERILDQLDWLLQELLRSEDEKAAPSALASRILDPQAATPTAPGPARPEIDQITVDWVKRWVPVSWYYTIAGVLVTLLGVAFTLGRCSAGK